MTVSHIGNVFARLEQFGAGISNKSGRDFNDAESQTFEMWAAGFTTLVPGMDTPWWEMSAQDCLDAEAALQLLEGLDPDACDVIPVLTQLLAMLPASEDPLNDPLDGGGEGDLPPVEEEDVDLPPVVEDDGDLPAEPVHEAGCEGVWVNAWIFDQLFCFTKPECFWKQLRMGGDGSLWCGSCVPNPAECYCRRVEFPNWLLLVIVGGIAFALAGPAGTATALSALYNILRARALAAGAIIIM